MKRVLLLLAAALMALLAACRTPEPEPGEIQVSVSPSTANVVVKNSAGAEMKASGDLVWSGLAPGLYTVEASAAGYETADKAVHVNAGETTRVKLELAVQEQPPAPAGPGSLHVTLQDRDTGEAISGAIAVTDASGQPVASAEDVTELVVSDLAEGTYGVSVQAEGYLDWGPQVVTVAGGKGSALAVKLTRTGAVGGNVGSVNIVQVVDANGEEYTIAADSLGNAFLAVLSGEPVGFVVEVLDENGAPLSGAPVTVNVLDDLLGRVAIYPGRIGEIAPAAVLTGLNTDADGRAYFILEAWLDGAPVPAIDVLVVVSANGDNNVAVSSRATSIFLPGYAYQHTHTRGEAAEVSLPVPQRKGSKLGPFTDRIWPGEDNAYRLKTTVVTEDDPFEGLDYSLFVYRIPAGSPVGWLDEDEGVVCDYDDDLREALELAGLDDLLADIEEGRACIDLDGSGVGLDVAAEDAPVSVEISVTHLGLVRLDDDEESDAPVYAVLEFGEYVVEKAWLPGSADVLHVDQAAEPASERGLGTLDDPLRSLDDAHKLIEEGGTIYLHAGEYDGGDTAFITTVKPGVTYEGYGDAADVLVSARVRADHEDVTFSNLKFKLSEAALTPGPTQAAIEIAADGVIVKDSIFVGPGTDVTRQGVTTQYHVVGAVITGNTFTNWKTGVYLNPGSGHEVSDNTFEDNFVGIGTDKVEGLQVTGNTFSGNEYEDLGLSAFDPVISGNEFGGPVAIKWYGGDESVDVSDNTFGSVYAADASIEDLFDAEDMLFHCTDGEAGFLQLRDESVFVTSSNSIQDGIDCAEDGWTVHVGAGDYGETLKIDKAIDVVAYDATLDLDRVPSVDRKHVAITGKGATFSGFTLKGYRAATGGDPIVSVDADEVTVSNLTFVTDDMPSFPYEIVVHTGRQDVTIEGNTVDRAILHGHPAIHIEGGNAGLVIDSNEVFNGAIGGNVDADAPITVTNNSVTYAYDEGFWFAGVASITFSGNSVENASSGNAGRADVKFTETPSSVNDKTIGAGEEAAEEIFFANPDIASVEIGGEIYSAD